MGIQIERSRKGPVRVTAIVDAEILYRIWVAMRVWGESMPNPGCWMDYIES